MQPEVQVWKNLAVYGFPVTIYPGFQETQIKGSTESLKNLLEDPENFERIYGLEHRLMFNPDAAARGNNLLVIGKR
jgi:hypothetical protein